MAVLGPNKDYTYVSFRVSFSALRTKSDIRGGDPFNIENLFILFFLVSNEITYNIFVSMYMLMMCTGGSGGPSIK